MQPSLASKSQYLKGMAVETHSWSSRPAFVCGWDTGWRIQRETVPGCWSEIPETLLLCLGFIPETWTELTGQETGLGTGLPAAEDSGSTCYILSDWNIPASESQIAFAVSQPPNHFGGRRRSWKGRGLGAAGVTRGEKRACLCDELWG